MSNEFVLNFGDMPATGGNGALMPKGEYTAELVGVEVREWFKKDTSGNKTETPEGLGFWFSLEWVIRGPKYNGKHLWMPLFPKPVTSNDEDERKQQSTELWKNWFSPLAALGMTKKQVNLNLDDPKSDVFVEGDKVKLKSVDGEPLPIGKQFTIMVLYSTNKESGEESEKAAWIVNKNTKQGANSTSQPAQAESAPRSPFGRKRNIG